MSIVSPWVVNSALYVCSDQTFAAGVRSSSRSIIASSPPHSAATVPNTM